VSDPDAALVRSWLAAAVDPAIAAGLEAVYTHASVEIARRGPTCWTSGKCCNFTAYGHRLYTTGLEAAYALTRLPAPDAASNAPASARPPRLTVLTPAKSLDACPFQVDKLCTVHAIRPMGCRVYFCDKTAQSWQHELSETLMHEIRALHDARALEYRYAEWRWLLDLFTPYLPPR
jgi:Fe-S-cluster containining protein